MDNQYVAQAQAAYQARDFQAASQAYVQLLQDPSVPKGPGDLGYLYHQLGNCLLQLKDFDSAIESYTQDRRFRLRCRGRGELQLGQSVRFQA